MHGTIEGDAARTQPVGDEDVHSREEQKRQPFFTGRVRVHPAHVDGWVRRVKWYALVGLLAIYYIAPWIRWDRGPNAPDQAILVDMAGRRLYFFWIEIWPQEVYYLTGLLILAAIGLFFITSLFGRVWCGFTCPQTVWTDLFMWVERKIEGDRNARIKLDAAPMSADKAMKRTAKHTAWLLIALLTGGAWAMYFNDAPTMVVDFVTGDLSIKVYFFIGLFTATTYLLAGWAREQVCTYMCPWPRFQAALLDEDSLVVTYRDWRGEPRGKHKKGEPWDDRGDCIDCKRCVAVCPTGIDIRDGIQLECIGCGLCIDACNDVMAKVDRPPNLIAFDTERNMARHARGLDSLYKVFRPRTIVYLAVLALVSGIMLYGLMTRTAFDLNVLHDRNPLYVTLSDGSIRNGYEVKILNKTRRPQDYRLTVEGLPAGIVQTAGGARAEALEGISLTVPPDQVLGHQVFISAPTEALDDAAVELRFVVTERDTGAVVSQDDVFRGPAR